MRGDLLVTKAPETFSLIITGFEAASIHNYSCIKNKLFLGWSLLMLVVSDCQSAITIA